MLRKNVIFAAVLFFGWLLADSIASLVFGSPLPGVHYPLASGTLKYAPYDWTDRSLTEAPLFLAAFGALWWFLLRRGSGGLRAASLISAFLVAPFWIVSAITADLYRLDLNGWWLASMLYANLSFLVYGFLGSGRAGDLRF